MTIKNTSSWLAGLLQACGLVFYVLLFTGAVRTAVSLGIDQAFNGPFLGMPLILTTFVFSALTCGTIGLGYPIILLSEKKVRRAVHIVCWTGFWLIVFLGLYLLTIVSLH